MKLDILWGINDDFVHLSFKGTHVKGLNKMRLPNFYVSGAVSAGHFGLLVGFFILLSCEVTAPLIKYCKPVLDSLCLFCCLTTQVNSYGRGGTVSSPNHTFSWASMNKQLTSTSCTYFHL